jgi:hypothetical protein
LVAQLQQAVEILDGAAIEPLGLRLEAKKGSGDVGLAGIAI